MGIRGLTTFIANNCSTLFQPYQLHDCFVVLDGHAVAYRLYESSPNRHDCFGGDYDKYAKRLRKFFKSLLDCNITPLVIFDGGYEQKKLNTIQLRLQSRVNDARLLNNVTDGSLFIAPLHLTYSTIDILLKMNIKVTRSAFEADEEIANLAYSLNCPVISCDSDFYIYGVQYIPFNTLELNLHKSKQGKNYMQCSLFKCENLVQFWHLNEDVLPLLAALLGNDYVKKAVFNKFFSEMKLLKCAGSDQQRLIKTVITWLRDQTLEMAIEKILNRFKIAHRNRILNKISMACSGYIRSRSKTFAYFNLGVNRRPIENNNNFHHVIEQLKNKGENVIENQEGEDLLVDEEEVEEGGAGEIELRSRFPFWFVQNYFNCFYPTWFIDITSFNKYFLNIQVENFHLPCSHIISFPLIAKMQQILTGKTEGPICNVNGKYERIEVNFDGLPSLEMLRDINETDSKSILFNILKINKLDSLQQLLQSVPSKWRLYLISIVFWIQNVKDVQIKSAHVYSLVLSALVLSKIIPMIGSQSESKLNEKFAEFTEKREKQMTDKKDARINNVSYEDGALCMKELIKYFENSAKVFNPNIIHAFAQFQSVFLHILHLNALLNKPFENEMIYEFYNGTFIYNLTGNLLQRKDVAAYLKTLLGNSLVPEIIRNIVEHLTSAAKCVLSHGRIKIKEKLKKVVESEDDDATVKVKKEPVAIPIPIDKIKQGMARTRFRRRSGRSSSDYDCDFDVDFVDSNNKFSILNQM